ncbi:MAG TPA: universal stress protein [Acidimicrobiales bacterium]|nr:universal stress protein [Acidimicrobiales bacterium]
MTLEHPVIVFGDDQSAHADRAWLWINNQRWPGWSVDVVTAVQERDDVMSDELPVSLTEWQPDSPRKAFAETGIASVRHLRSTGNPARVLGSCRHASLVVVGPRGTNPLKNMFLGSTADNLLREPPAPLVIAKTPGPATRVLVCTDGSPNARRAAETFAGLPLAGHTDHVGVIGVIGVVAMAVPDQRGQIDKGVDAAAELLSARNPEPIRVESEGDVATALLEHATGLRTQLVVLGTRGFVGLRRIVRLGSTAGAVVRTAAASVLVVPEG